jgi:cbb3-type cytochrome oxidase maturation protein
MDILFILIPAALGLGVLGLLAFVWTLGHQQYEDLAGAAARILSDAYDKAPDPDPGPDHGAKSP